MLYSDPRQHRVALIAHEAQLLVSALSELLGLGGDHCQHAVCLAGRQPSRRRRLASSTQLRLVRVER